jgi:hypothetical protein
MLSDCKGQIPDFHRVWAFIHIFCPIFCFGCGRIVDENVEEVCVQRVDLMILSVFRTRNPLAAMVFCRLV